MKPCTRRYYMHQWRDREFQYLSQKSSLLAVAACMNGETAIFGMYHEEVHGLPLLHG